jgi:hypothetical protein
VARLSMPLGIALTVEPGEPGSGGRGMDGGGVGSAVGVDLRAWDEAEPERASAIAAASGESDSRLKLVMPSDWTDWRLYASTCCCELLVRSAYRGQRIHAYLKHLVP